jgi:hypothetical protein
MKDATAMDPISVILLEKIDFVSEARPFERCGNANQTDRSFKEGKDSKCSGI